MKVLVAGGAGYIGSTLSPELADRGHDVTVVDELWFGNYLPASVKVLKRNLFDITREDLTEYEQVIFLAGLSNDPMAEFSPALNFVYNGALPSYLAYQAKQAGVRRFIYASSCSVYGHAADKYYDENDPTACQYPYGVAKLQGERGVLQLGDSRFSTIALRQGTVCGYSPRMRFDLIVNTMYMTAIRDGHILVHNPNIWRPILDIRDACSAFVRAVEAEASTSGVFNVASGNFTVRDVGRLVQEAITRLTGRKIDLTVHNTADPRNYRVTCQRAEKVLSFVPRYSIWDIVESLHHHRDEYGDFARDSYVNITVFKQRLSNRNFPG